MAMTKRDVRYNISKVDRKRQNAVVIEYEFNGIEYEAAVIVSAGRLVTTGCKKYTDTITGDIKIDSVSRDEAELLLALAEQYEYEHKPRIPDVLDQALRPFVPAEHAVLCPQCGGLLMHSEDDCAGHCTQCERRGE